MITAAAALVEKKSRLRATIPQAANPTVFLNAGLFAKLLSFEKVTSRSGKARQRAARRFPPYLLRWALWMACKSAELGGVEWLHAHPALVARDFEEDVAGAIGRKQRRPLGREVAGKPSLRRDGTPRVRKDGKPQLREVLASTKRTGMSEATLGEARALFLEHFARVTGDGRYHLRRIGKQFHALPLSEARKLLYASNAALVVGLSVCATLHQARDKGHHEVAMPARRSAARAGVSASRFCRAIREARIEGLLNDDRPGDKRILGSERYPMRTVFTTSPLTPLKRGEIVTIRPKNPKCAEPAKMAAPSLWDTPCGTHCKTSSVFDLGTAKPPACGAADELSGASPERSPSERSEPGDVVPLLGSVRLTTRLAFRAVREYLAEQPAALSATVPSPEAIRPMRRIAEAAGTVAVLRRFLRDAIPVALVEVRERKAFWNWLATTAENAADELKAGTWSGPAPKSSGRREGCSADGLSAVAAPAPVASEFASNPTVADSERETALVLLADAQREVRHAVAVELAQDAARIAARWGHASIARDAVAVVVTRSELQRGEDAAANLKARAVAFLASSAAPSAQVLSAAPSSPEPGSFAARAPEKLLALMRRSRH